MSASTVSEGERVALCVTLRRIHRERLAADARANERSVAGELRHVLDQHFGLSPVRGPVRTARDDRLESRMR